LDCVASAAGEAAWFFDNNTVRLAKPLEVPRQHVPVDCHPVRPNYVPASKTTYRKVLYNHALPAADLQSAVSVAFDDATGD
jgi:hypothetical protein